MNPVTLPVAWAPQQQPAPQAGDRHAGSTQGTDDLGADQWHLQRRCSLSPAQFGGCFGLLTVVSVLVAAFFWALGARFVTLFAGVEVLVVGVAFALHALHAADGERLRVAEGCLHVERRNGTRLEHESIPLQGLRARAAADGSIELLLRGRRWMLGRHAAEAPRRQVLAGLRRVLASVNG
jgi:uncharacterized membrane protein